MRSISIWHWILVFSIVAVVAIIVVKARKSSAASAANGEGPTGIGGWLVLPIIGFVATIGLTSFNLVSVLGNLDGLKFIYSGDAGAYSQLRLPVALSLTFGTAIIISAAICLYKIFISRGRIKGIAVGHFSILLIGAFVELWADSVFQTVDPGVAADPQIARDAGRSVLAALIWIPYFLVSKRIQNTFGEGVQANASG